MSISIHAPHTGRDFTPVVTDCPVHLFQSTRPIRGATYKVADIIPGTWISIHAPHTGRDGVPTKWEPVDMPFQSTRPIRGATSITITVVIVFFTISIHAPHTGRDEPASMSPVPRFSDFNPRAPYGARLTAAILLTSADRFQSTRPIRGATGFRVITEFKELMISIHAPHTGRDPS